MKIHVSICCVKRSTRGCCFSTAARLRKDPVIRGRSSGVKVCCLADERNGSHTRSVDLRFDWHHHVGGPDHSQPLSGRDLNGGCVTRDPAHVSFKSLVSLTQ